MSISEDAIEEEHDIEHDEEDNNDIELVDRASVAEDVLSQTHSRHNSGHGSVGHGDTQSGVRSGASSRHNSGHSVHSGNRRQRTYRNSEDVSLVVGHLLLSPYNSLKLSGVGGKG